MQSSIFSQWSRFAPRKLAALLVALSVALLLPACSAFASPVRGVTAGTAIEQHEFAAGHAQHHGAALQGEICASVGTSALVAASVRLSAAQFEVEFPMAPFPASYPVTASPPARSTIAASPPPVQASFHIRSARILR